MTDRKIFKMLLRKVKQNTTVLEPDNPDSCIVCSLRLTKRGYSQASTEWIRYYSHRLVLESKLGRPIKPGFEACHKCDRPNCVREDHLFEASHQENMVDASNKNRIKNNFPDKWHRERKR